MAYDFESYEQKQAVTRLCDLLHPQRGEICEEVDDKINQLLDRMELDIAKKYIEMTAEQLYELEKLIVLRGRGGTPVFEKVKLTKKEREIEEYKQKRDEAYEEKKRLTHEKNNKINEARKLREGDPELRKYAQEIDSYNRKLKATENKANEYIDLINVLETEKELEEREKIAVEISRAAPSETNIKKQAQKTTAAELNRQTKFERLNEAVQQGGPDSSDTNYMRDNYSDAMNEIAAARAGKFSINANAYKVQDAPQKAFEVEQPTHIVQDA